ncbi:MAG: winged helix-turn-helix transcriptional regulator [Promethearchaeota archaeon]
MDYALIQELVANGRVSYQALANKFNFAPNTIKNRIKRLQKQNVLGGYLVVLKMAMIGAEHVAGYVFTDGSEKVIEFMEQIASHPAVAEIYRTGDMRYEYWAMVSGASETLGFERFLQDLNGVREVEVRPVEFLFPNMPAHYYMNSSGKKVTFSNSQLKVLRCLFDDGRMPVSQIAKRTGFTTRRVRKILSELIESDTINITAGFNIFALGDMEYRLKIRFDESLATGKDIIKGIYKKYPNDFWWASFTTNEPIVDIGLIIDRPGAAVPIINEVKAASYTRSVEDYVSYPRVVFGNFPLRFNLAELLIDAGLLDSDHLLWGPRGGKKISYYVERSSQFRV